MTLEELMKKLSGYDEELTDLRQQVGDLKTELAQAKQAEPEMPTEDEPETLPTEDENGNGVDDSQELSDIEKMLQGID